MQSAARSELPNAAGGIVNQQETHRLFNECQAKRQAALASGASDAAADAAARDHWNAWAEGILKEKPEGRSDRDWEAKAAAIYSSQDSKFYLPANTSFHGWIFPGKVDFKHATFQGRAQFGSSQFEGDADFAAAQFKETVWFASAQFRGSAKFENAKFEGNAGFNNTEFEGSAKFIGARFHRDAWFNNVEFKGTAEFARAEFEGSAWFANAEFAITARFHRTRFVGDVWFPKAEFNSSAAYIGTEFEATAGFSGALFRGTVWLTNAKFKGSAWFSDTTFQGIAEFDGATWDGTASFAQSEFHGDATFQAAKASRAFSLAGATFHAVPDFVQANFSEAPRLDNLHIRRSLVQPRRLWLKPLSVCSAARPVRMQVRSILPRLRVSRVMVRMMAEPLLFWRATKRAASRIRQRLSGTLVDEPVKWRALRRLAIQGHDHQREQSYFSQELRARWFVEDCLIPIQFWRPNAWVSLIRLLLSVLYGILSDFGRSVILPFLWLTALTSTFIWIYLGPVHQARLADVMPAPRVVTVDDTAWWANGGHALNWSWATLSWPARLWYLDPKKYPSCWTPQLLAAGTAAALPRPLPQVVANETDVVRETIRLSLAKASVVGGLGEPEAARRAYGCLYGLEQVTTGNPTGFTLAHIPGWVSDWARWQKLLSAILIFLFGLSLRNMLKLK